MMRRVLLDHRRISALKGCLSSHHLCPVLCDAAGLCLFVFLLSPVHLLGQPNLSTLSVSSSTAFNRNTTSRGKWSHSVGHRFRRLLLKCGLLQFSVYLQSMCRQRHATLSILCLSSLTRHFGERVCCSRRFCSSVERCDCKGSKSPSTNRDALFARTMMLSASTHCVEMPSSDELAFCGGVGRRIKESNLALRRLHTAEHCLFTQSKAVAVKRVDLVKPCSIRGLWDASDFMHDGHSACCRSVSVLRGCFVCQGRVHSWAQLRDAQR